MILFVNACVREESRTLRLARHLLSGMEGSVTELRLSNIDFPVVNEDFLNKRDRLIAASDYQNPMFDLARQFAAADQIVIAAPYWDLSFPAVLKQYIEQINVLGVTFVYTPEGFPKGLCKARKLYYVTTAGGNYVPSDYGFGYVKSLAELYYGIPETELIQATGLDIDGADTEGILSEALKSIKI